MDIRGEFTERERWHFSRGFERYIIWAAPENGKRVFYAWRDDWPKENRLVLQDFEEFVNTLDMIEGYYPNSKAENRFKDSRLVEPDWNKADSAEQTYGTFYKYEKPAEPNEPSEPSEPAEPPQKSEKTNRPVYKHLRFPDV